MSLPKLPPVRKRADYGDIRSDDLTFALFYTTIGQDLAALDKATEPMIKKAFEPTTTWNGWAAITKVDEERRIVYGIASTEEPDDQPGIFKGEQYAGDIVSSAAMQAAAPAYLEYPAIREMHQPSAAGTAVHFEVNGGQTLVGAHVVDDQAWAKVTNKVYRGFSIGGKMEDAEIVKIGGTAYRKITKLKLNEISLVDRPANPQARITLYKGADMEIDQGATGVADDSELSKAADPTKAIGLLQQLRNDAELDGDMDAADAYTAAIRSVAEGAGIAVAADDDEDADLTDDTTGDGITMADDGSDGDMAMAAAVGDIQKAHPGLTPDQIGDILKRGAMLSGQNLAHLRDAHDSINKASGGVVCAPGAGQTMQKQPPIQMAAGLTGQDFAKALAPAFEGIAKVLEANGITIAALQQQVDQLSRQPAPGGPLLRIVEKSLPGEVPAQQQPDAEQAQLDMLRKQLADATDAPIQKYLSEQISRIEFRKVYTSK